MKKKFLFNLLFVGLLVSCRKVTLRSDIANFIASFSLETAINEYREAGYTKVTTAVTKNETTIITEKFDFNIKNNEHPTYQKETITEVNNVVKTILKEYISENSDGTFDFHKSNGSIETYSLLQAHELIQKYFYTITEFDGKYHDGGMYYGDTLTNGARGLQNFIVIDEEAKILKVDFEVKGYSQDGVIMDIHQIYQVDKFGMLLSNNTTTSNSDIQVITNIITYKI